MRIGIYEPQNLKAFSLRLYTQNVKRELSMLGVEWVSFDRKESLPSTVDLYWDPRAAGGGTPPEFLWDVVQPLVVTLHGAGKFHLPFRERHHNLIRALVITVRNQRKKKRWRKLVNRCSAVITVSDYARQEISQCLALPLSKIVPIYHGIDHTVFVPSTRIAKVEPYLLHVSQYNSKKNIRRIIQAYSALEMADKPKLLAVVPFYPSSVSSNGVQFIRRSLTHKQLALHYQTALGFLFPSLHESFGLPILEAMACGCPVITSNTTACVEIGGDAALLVDPYSVDDIATAVRRLIEDVALRERLRHRGLEHAALFTWEKTVQQHLRVFENVLNQ